MLEEEFVDVKIENDFDSSFGEDANDEAENGYDLEIKMEDLYDNVKLYDAVVIKEEVEDSTRSQDLNETEISQPEATTKEQASKITAATSHQMEMEPFDTQLFILEVKKRPLIWDLTSEDHGNRDSKKKAWKDLAELFGGKDIPDKEKKELGQSLQKKWKSIRDSYARELRRLKKIESGAPADRKRPYMYTKQLSFLRKSSTTGSTSQETEEAIVEKKQATLKNKAFHTQKEIKNMKKGNKKKLIDHDDGAEREKQTELDEDKLFLLSLVSSLKKVPKPRKLSTKMELMNVLQSNLASAAGYQSPHRSQSLQSSMSLLNYSSSQSFLTSHYPLQQFASVCSSKLNPDQSYSGTEQRPESCLSAQSIDSASSADNQHCELLDLF